MGQVLLNAIANSGNPPVTLNADWTLEQRDGLQAGRGQTLTEYQQFIWSRTKQFSLPIVLISSADTNTINGWWRTAQILDFTLNSSEGSTLRTQLVGSSLPVGQFDPPYRSLYRATLLLRALDTSDFGANP